MIVQEIQDLKQAGYSLNEVIDHLAARPGKTPCRATVRKYYDMDGVPEDLHAKTAKPHAFDAEPFRSDILEILALNPKCYVSSVHDVLLERHVESGDYEILPGNEQTLRNYVRWLRDTGQVAEREASRRTYDHVDDPPAGRQLQLDFGQLKCDDGLTVHFLCMLLRMSRYLGVCAQDHRFDSEEACVAIYRFMCKVGGRVEELVIDQDSVFVGSEIYGEVFATETFDAFLKEQDLRLWCCNKHDPESKGAVENSVKFVKSSFFSARRFSTIEQVRDALPGWCERKNNRIHQTTFRVPAQVFEEEERPALRPLLPSVHEAAPTNLVAQAIAGQPFLQYRASKYSVPWEFCYKTVYYKAIGDKLHVYGPDRKHCCTHQVNPVRGSFNRLDEHRRQEATDWMDVAERLRRKWNCAEFQHLINGFKKENPRHLAAQLRQVELLLDAERPDRALVTEVIGHCCREFRYRFTQFRAVYELHAATWAARGEADAEPPTMDEVQARDVERYREAYRRRCES